MVMFYYNYRTVSNFNTVATEPTSDESIIEEVENHVETSNVGIENEKVPDKVGGVGPR